MGTAAVISLVKELRYKDVEMKFDIDSFTIAEKVKQQLNDIREGRTGDEHGWMFKV